MRLRSCRTVPATAALAVCVVVACQAPNPAAPESRVNPKSTSAEFATRPGDAPTTLGAASSTATAAARARLDAGDAEGAQAAFARVRADDPREVAAHVGFGDASYRLFQEAVADPRRGNATLYLQDALAGYRQAAELDATCVEAQLGLSRVLRELGQGVEAAAAAQRARDRLPWGSPKELRVAVLLELGRARATEFLEAVRDQASPVTQGEIYARAVEALRSAAKIEPASPEPILEIAQLELGRGASVRALEVLCEAVKDHPEEEAYHRWLCDIGARFALLSNLAEIYDVKLATLQDGSPTVCWYAGFVKMREAEALRAARDYRPASSAYDTSAGLFERAGAMNPAFSQSVKTYLALVLAGRARCRFEEGAIEDAAELLTSAFRANPGILDADDGLGISPKRTSLEIGGELFKRGELERGAVLFETWLASVPGGTDVDWLNNAGLMRRDLGEKLDEEGLHDEAMRSFEAAYVHYAKVAELRPDEPRLVNDAALMLLYHLDRDLDKAEAMFRRAIELGEAQLEELGDRPDDPEGPDAEVLAAMERWDYFAEATGDACQNLALLLWKRGAESAEIRRLFARAFELDPRGTRSYFRSDVNSLPESGPAPRWERPLR